MTITLDQVLDEAHRSTPKQKSEPSDNYIKSLARRLKSFMLTHKMDITMFLVLMAILMWIYGPLLAVVLVAFAVSYAYCIFKAIMWISERYLAY